MSSIKKGDVSHKVLTLAAFFSAFLALGACCSWGCFFSFRSLGGGPKSLPVTSLYLACFVEGVQRAGRQRQT